jgi:4-hydroxy-2-oxoglutarate aldolase
MKLQGVFAPIPTPFDDNDRVDLDRLMAAVARWMASPLDGIVVLGSTGEAPLLDEEESERAVVATRESVPFGRTLIVGTGRESTKGTIRACRRAAELGADAVLVRTPGFFKSQMSTEVLVEHYTAVADASPLPVLLYNFTAVTGVNLLPAAVSRLSAHPNIAGVKESGGDVGQIGDLVSQTPDDFVVLAGSAPTFYPALCVGASGGVLALSCVVPAVCARLYALTTSGRHDEARELQRRLVPLARLIGPVHGVPGLKAVLALAGYDVGRPRPPLLPVRPEAMHALRQALAELEESIPAGR